MIVRNIVRVNILATLCVWRYVPGICHGATDIRRVATGMRHDPLPYTKIAPMMQCAILDARTSRPSTRTRRERCLRAGSRDLSASTRAPRRSLAETARCGPATRRATRTSASTQRARRGTSQLPSSLLAWIRGFHSPLCRGECPRSLLWQKLPGCWSRRSSTKSCANLSDARSH